MYSYIQNSMSVIHKNNYFTDINDLIKACYDSEETCFFIVHKH